MTGYCETTLAASDMVATPEGEQSEYERWLDLRPLRGREGLTILTFGSALVDETEGLLPGGRRPLNAVRLVRRKGQRIFSNKCDFVLWEPIVRAVPNFVPLYIGRNAQTAFNQTSPSEPVPVEASTEVDPALQRQSRLVDKLVGLARLSPGWDGLDAPPADHSAIGRALELVRALCQRASVDGVSLPEPVVGPTGAGSVQLEWQEGQRFLAVEVPVPSEPLSFFADIDGEEILSDEARPEAIWAVVSVMAHSEP